MRHPFRKPLSRSLAAFVLLAAAAIAAGCADEDSSGAALDASTTEDTDTGGPGQDTDEPGADTDTGAEDTGPEDTGPDDTDEPDSTEPDTTDGDVGEDAPDPDSTEPDTIEPDAVDPDAVDPDTVDPDTTEPDTVEPDTTEPPSGVVLPLGETLYLSGDDYLYFWAGPPACGGSTVSVVAAPETAFAAIITSDGDSPRLTPDVAGPWTLARCGEEVTIEVVEDYLNEDTFLNYNYTPSVPVVATADDELWVVAPTSNAVQRIAVLATGEATVEELIPTGSWPTSLAHWPSANLLLVSQTGRDSIGLIDVETRTLVDAIWVGDEPASIIVDEAHPDGPRGYVALSGADSVAIVDLAARRVESVIPVSRDPRALAFDPTTRLLYAASLLSSNAHPRGLVQGTNLPAEEQKDIAVIDVDTATIEGWVFEVGTMLRGLWLSPDGSELRVALSHSNNLQSNVAANSKPHTHAIATVDTNPDSPTAWTVTSEVSLDDQPTSTGPAASPFSMLLLPGGEVLAVTLSAGNAVLLLDAQTLEEIDRRPTGSDPRGLVVLQDHLWTTPWLDNTVASWPLGTLALGGVAPVGSTVDIGNDPRPADVQNGQRLFNDASFSGNQDFSCNNCHIDGLTDGLVWNLLIDGDVATLQFRNVGGTGPFLWGGVLPTLFDFSREVLKLVGADATGQEMEDLTTYMQSVTAPPNPHTLPGGAYSEQAKWGREIFEAPAGQPGGAGCAECHSGPLLTIKSIVEGKTNGLGTDVPSLISVYDTAPYGRQSTWDTLEEMVEFAVGFTGSALTGEELAALTEYVRQLPGDLLYLSSALPLDGSEAAFSLSPIELAFSGVLAPEQDDYFTIEAEGTAVPGVWTTSGRWARFAPDAGALALETNFTISVAAGLRGALGQELTSPIQITFATGGVPAFDLSGDWTLNVSEPLSGSIQLAFIQSAGGQVSGVVLDGGGLIEIDFVEGFITDDSLVLDPFLVASDFGDILTDGVQATLTDDDGDGFADQGSGKVFTPFIDLDVTFFRNGEPPE